MPASFHENLDASAPSRIKEAGFARVILNGAKRSEGFPVRQHGESSPDGFQNIGKSISCQHCAILHKILRFVQAFLRSRKCRQDKKCNHSNDVMQSLLSGTPVQKTNENNELPPHAYINIVIIFKNILFQCCNFMQCCSIDVTRHCTYAISTPTPFQNIQQRDRTSVFCRAFCLLTPLPIGQCCR